MGDAFIAKPVVQDGEVAIRVLQGRGLVLDLDEHHLPVLEFLRQQVHRAEPPLPGGETLAEIVQDNHVEK